ncbi:MAG: hypothetical protein RM022_013035 [Nostoc sp. EfeVER01]|uniref:hypothetical protein n=1 Tax=unclassified Nostoc TaxID=2593658 RepID=UPI002AD538D7|nr:MULTISPECIES: hypothetical protein [unclassified Nostoc]MDZ7947500.1 hypothetical protein [Nostoc sp. EfeVER01]MDZ7996066.1 hypothetical protein [Nostoc sp. EspVER01]
MIASVVETSSPEKLFKSTAQSLDFWLSVAKKRETMPAKDYLAYLDSFGWNRRSAGPYVKLADFIREHLPGQIGAIAKLDIRTLLKLPLPRYAPIVEEIRTAEPTQAQITELIKKLPSKPREKYKSVEEKKDEAFELNVPAQTGKLISETAELLGLSKQRTIEVNCELVKTILSGVDPTDAIARFKQQFAKHEEEPLKADYEVEALELQTDLEPYPVQWHHEGEIYASWLTNVKGECALLEVNDVIYSVPLSDLKKIDLEAIASEISDHKKLSYPYQQLYINAVNAKQEWVTLQALSDGDETYDSVFKQYTRWMSCAVNGVKRNGIWLDLIELEENQRLVLVPGGDDLIANVANEPRFKHKVSKTSFLEAFYSGVPDVPSLEQRLKEADDWDEIASLVQRNNKTLTQATEYWTLEEKQQLIAKLATFLESSFTCAIQDREVAWLHQAALAKALAKLEFEVKGQVCKFQKFIDYGTGGEQWIFRTEKSETIVASCEEVKIFRF